MSSSSACAATIAVTPDGSTSAESMTSGSSGRTPCARVGRKRVRTPSRWKRTVKKKSVVIVDRSMFLLLKQP